MIKNIPELFGSMVFNDIIMQARLPKDTYKALKKTIALGRHLTLDVANTVASIMKEWALEKGATHYSHWFQPMTGITAEKHDSFISPIDGGRVIMEFSGKALVKGEPDASSFPSGGLRATFEARGYTAWDPTSYAFVKDRTLYIPTVFCSYGGETLDKKTPLLRSMEALNNQALRILRLFGNTTVRRVITTVGPEQEYFLVDKEVYNRRPDLIYCGRTLFGARPPKGQEMDDHYFGALNPRVSAYMQELDEELWKLGVLAKTEHKEAAPAQHELAPIFTTGNIATDHNQLTMELIKVVAERHGLVALLHEKPFDGVNGSGKHNNWSLCTDTGANLLEPGDTPFENAQFLMFLVAVIKAVDDYQDLLRVTVASAANDHRLGANEAPPAIISVFLGDELTEILDSIESGTEFRGREKIQMEVGATVLPHFPKDATDRNRTSPFAFTGNKFEFRMPGSAFSIAGPNFVLNTIVAEVLGQFADKLEGSVNFTADLGNLIRQSIKDHKRIIFNGNNYSEEWLDESAKRGLSNLKTTVEALPAFIKEKNIAVFTKHGVLSKSEIFSRYEILLEMYCKTIRIEALTFIDLVHHEVIPASIGYQTEIAELLHKKKDLNSLININTTLEEDLLNRLSHHTSLLYHRTREFELAVAAAGKQDNSLDKARYYRYSIFSVMTELRQTVDELEAMVSRKHWPLPTYAEILYSVK